MAEQHREYRELDSARVEAAVREFLIGIGEDPDREGLLETPARVARACKELLGGMQEDPSQHLLKQFNEGNSEEMVIVKDIPFSSLCEHHILPFIGKAHIAYIPKGGRVTGLSKLGRLVDSYAHRLQVQERMTTQIADSLMEALDPLGCLVVLEAEHMCMNMRGIKKTGSITVTSAVRGCFREQLKTREEALRLLGVSA